MHSRSFVILAFAVSSYLCAEPISYHLNCRGLAAHLIYSSPLNSLSEQAKRDLVQALPETRTAFALELIHLRRHLTIHESHFLQRLFGIDRDEVWTKMKEMSNEEVEKVSHHWAGMHIADSSVAAIHELDRLLSIKPGQTLVDVGSGTGTPGFYFGLKYPQLNFIGFELVGPKAEASQQNAEALGLANVRFFQQDLSDPHFSVPPSDYYFFFNPVNRDVAAKVIGEIEQISRTRKITLLISYGVAHPLETEQWLRQVRQSGRSTVYESR